MRAQEALRTRQRGPGTRRLDRRGGAAGLEALTALRTSAQESLYVVPMEGVRGGGHTGTVIVEDLLGVSLRGTGVKRAVLLEQVQVCERAAIPTASPVGREHNPQTLVQFVAHSCAETLPCSDRRCERPSRNGCPRDSRHLIRFETVGPLLYKK